MERSMPWLGNAPAGSGCPKFCPSVQGGAGIGVPLPSLPYFIPSETLYPGASIFLPGVRLTPATPGYGVLGVCAQ